MGIDSEPYVSLECIWIIFKKNLTLSFRKGNMIVQFDYYSAFHEFSLLPSICKQNTHRTMNAVLALCIN
jgi:hypothetical protein